MRFIASIWLVWALPWAALPAGEFEITRFGATADDQTDDTAAIEAALAACAQADGGTVVVPAGTFMLSRRNNESPILEVPPNTTIRGEGAASTLKFAAEVNQSNFWRMIGAPVDRGTNNVVIRDLHLDGSNTHPKYVKGETPEHNAGLWFYNKDHVIENVIVQNVFAENFSGDCMAFSYNCRGISLRDCTLRNFIRQGIQLGGSSGSRDYLVTGCRDLEHSVQPGGSTIHVEHARADKRHHRKQSVPQVNFGGGRQWHDHSGQHGDREDRWQQQHQSVAVRQHCSSRRHDWRRHAVWIHPRPDHQRQHHPWHRAQPDRHLCLG